MTRRELVTRAIEFKTPGRVPIWFFNKDQRQGDIMSFELSPFRGGKVKKSEWGYIWENLGNGTIGQPKVPVLPTWDSLKDYTFPDPNHPARFKGINQFKSEAGDRYLIAEMGITGFNTYAFLRGFANALMDFKLEREKACFLLDKIFEFENEVIKISAQYGFNGIHFADDWGTQKALIINPDMWRELFKPYYKIQFKLVHDLGMHVWFHSCGNITSIIPDFHEIGVDVMNISQPNVVDIHQIGKLLKGKQCFMVPISYQTVSINGTPQDIEAEAKRLYSELGTHKGGFIGYIEEYSVMGMSEENYKACIASFKNLEV